MLVLGRRIGESISIGPDIVIIVCEMNLKGTVKIGIQAPPEINIVRTELLERTEQDDGRKARRRGGARELPRQRKVAGAG
jgi:carbon storage regulator